MAWIGASVNLLQCIIVICAFSAATIQGRSSRRTHNRHRAESEKLLDIEREMIEELERDLTSLESRNQRTGHRDDYDERTSVLRSTDDRNPRILPWSLERLHAIAKRHNEDEDEVGLEIMSEEEESELEKSRARNMYHSDTPEKSRKKRYEVEIKQAQNSSLCNYTVIDIPDMSEDQSRRPKKLVDVKCNHPGSRCRHVGTYYCIQTYGKVDVSYANGTTYAMKIYTGCVCSLRAYGELSPYKTPIHHQWRDRREP